MDHRDIGQKLKLFMFHPYSPGCPIWLPRGNTLYSILSNKIRKFLVQNGYEEVRTPVLWKKQLFEQSGHWSHFADNMFKIEDDEKETYALKPMNCPGHMLIFKSQQFSYQDLPYRLHDQGMLHRNEVSGALGGLTRCRSFCQDDGHIFIREDQLEEEINNIYETVVRIYNRFNMHVSATLSTRPTEFMGEPVLWDKAEAILANILKGRCDYTVDAGGGAFYGPKIDFRIKDSLGREFQTATIQLDFQLPVRFELSYTDTDGGKKCPIVIHRALFGSFERFVGILLEHYQGKLPSWLNPVQVNLLPIADRHIDVCQKANTLLREKGVRSQILIDNMTLSKKILRAREDNCNYMLIAGDKESFPNFTVRKLDSDGSDQSVMSCFDIAKEIELENTDF